MNNFNASVKKKVSLIQLLDDDAEVAASERISPATHQKMFSTKRFSNAQLITFTEKSVGIISERSRDPKM